MIKVSVLRSFHHVYGSKDEYLKAGSIYYLDIENAEDRDELLYMMSGSYPYRHFISIEMSPALMQVLSMSKFTTRNSPPINPQEGEVYYNLLSKKAYYWNGSTWLEFPCPDCSGTGTGTGGSMSTIPALFGDVSSTGFTNEVTITPGAIVDADISANAAIQLTKLAKDPLSRMNHTGVQPASTIVDFDEQVRTNRLDQMGLPMTDLDLNHFRVVNLKDPVSPKDGANKDYVDAKVENLNLNDIEPPIADYSLATFGLKDMKDPIDPQDAATKAYVDELLDKASVKAPVRVVSTTNVSLAGSQSIDGRTVNVGDRVLVAGQSDARLNGIYIVQSGAWIRATDADTSEELSNGVTVYAQDGTNYADTLWIMTSPNGPVVLGVSSLMFGQPGTTLPGDGLYKNGTTIHVGGKAGEIVAYPDEVGIDPTWPGQTSITTLGTITTGRWQGVAVDIPYGGTGATTKAGARSNLEAAKSGINSDITQLTGLTTPLTIPQGGTGASTAPDALINLGAASRGINSDITQLTGLTTPLSITQGGTGGADPTSARNNLQAAKSGANNDITSLNAAFTKPLTIQQGGTNGTTALDARINLDTARTGVNIGGASRVFSSKNGNTDLEFRTLRAATGNRVSVVESGSNINFDVIEANLMLPNLGGSLDLNSAKITGILPISKGGTEATTALQALINLGGIGTIAKEPSSAGVTIIGTKDGADPTKQYMKGVLAGSTKTLITSNPYDVSIDIDETQIPINNLLGVLAINKGGTNATTADQALKNLNGIGDGLNLSSGGVAIFSHKDTSGIPNVLTFKGVRSNNTGLLGGSKVLVTDAGTDVVLDIQEPELNLANMGGILDIANGGTSATTAGDALYNLAGLYDLANAGGTSLIRDKVGTPGSGYLVNLKGIEPASAKVLVADTGNTVSVDVDEAELDLANLGGVLPISKGGTGATTPEDARIALGIPMVYMSTALSPSTTTYQLDVNHGLGSTDLMVFVHDVTGNIEYPTNIQYTSADSIRITFPGLTGDVYVRVMAG